MGCHIITRDAIIHAVLVCCHTITHEVIIQAVSPVVLLHHHLRSRCPSYWEGCRFITHGAIIHAVLWGRCLITVSMPAVRLLVFFTFVILNAWVMIFILNSSPEILTLSQVRFGH